MSVAAEPYVLERLGVVMEPEPGEPLEAWGVLNPAAARDRHGELWLFARLVAEGNLSRVGRARVLFEGDRPVGVERAGVALEPGPAWERNAHTAGVEDPRIVWVPALERFVMTYSAYGPLAARIGLAVSSDLERWERLGPAWFAYQPELETDLNLYPNKDAVLFPEAVAAPDGRPSFAMLHRPMWDLSWVRPGEGVRLPAGLDDPSPGIWVSFASAEHALEDLSALVRFDQHRLVALPEQPWEKLKIGAGTPPVPVRGGWLVLHHGVAGRLVAGTDHQRHASYSAGFMVLDSDDVTKVVARSTAPLLEPVTPGEREGIVPRVVFPTGIDVREGHADVYYGMADSRIGAGRLSPIEAP